MPAVGLAVLLALACSSAGAQWPSGGAPGGGAGGGQFGSGARPYVAPAQPERSDVLHRDLKIKAPMKGPESIRSLPQRIAPDWRPAGAQWQPGDLPVLKSAVRQLYPDLAMGVQDEDVFRRFGSLLSPRTANILRALQGCQMCVPVPGTPDPGGGAGGSPLPPVPSGTPTSVPASRPDDAGRLMMAARPLQDGRLTYVTDPVGFTDVVKVYRQFSSGERAKSACSGTRVAQRWVVTAAHCVPSAEQQAAGMRVQVLVPRPDAAQLLICRAVMAQEQRYGAPCVRFSAVVATRVLVHPGYVAIGGPPRPNTDIALVQLPDGVDWGGARLASIDPLAHAPENIAVAGYGKTFVPGSPDNLLEVGYRMQVHWNDEGRIHIEDDSLSSACEGDSGGPVFRGVPWGSAGEAHRLFGVVSFGQKADGLNHCKAPFDVSLTRLADPDVRSWICGAAAEICS